MCLFKWLALLSFIYYYVSISLIVLGIKCSCSFSCFYLLLYFTVFNNMSSNYYCHVFPAGTWVSSHSTIPSNMGSRSGLVLPTATLAPSMMSLHLIYQSIGMQPWLAGVCTRVCVCVCVCVCFQVYIVQ